MLDDIFSDTYYQDFKHYETNPTVIIDFLLSGKNIFYTRSVRKMDQYITDFIDYMWNVIMVLYIFNYTYNEFGARVYVSSRFFVKNPNLTDDIVAILKEKISKISSNKR